MKRDELQTDYKVGPLLQHSIDWKDLIPMATETKAPERICPECKGLTVQFGGHSLDLQYRICTRYESAGHLSKEEINAEINRRRQAIRPSGRYA